MVYSMDFTTDKETVPIDEYEAGKICQVHNLFAVLYILFVVFSSVFGVSFVGGYFIAKIKMQTESKESTQSYQHRAYSVHYDGSSQIVPAFRGSVPVQDFVQPRTVLVNGQLVITFGNPLLTPKGTSQIFLYQYEDEVSMIVTATGHNYGERVTNGSLIGEGQYTLTTTGLQGDLIQLTDVYHQLYNRVPIPNSFSAKLQWGNVGSHGFIVILSDPSSVDATVKFSNLTGIKQPLNIRGCYEYDTEIPELPSQNSLLRITPYNRQFSLHNKPDCLSETPIPSGSESSSLQLVHLHFNSSRRRSMATRMSPGIGLILYQPGTKNVLYRIELRREERHGGKNGTLCWNVQNHVNHVEASFCALFHQTLYGYNGVDNEPSDDSGKSMLINTHFRSINDQPLSLGSWKHVVALVHDFYPDFVIQSPKNRNVRTTIGWFEILEKKSKQLISDVSQSTHKEWIRVKEGCKTAYKAVTDEIYSITDSDNRRRRNLWNCDWSESLWESSKCVLGAANCGTDLAGDLPFGLDTVLAVVGCSSAINDCTDFGSYCF